MAKGVTRFGVFQLTLPQGELRKHGVPLRLSGHSLSILLLLVKRRGEIVTREEIEKQLWPAHTDVDFQQGLNTAVKKLRSILGDSPESPRYIETIAGVGYRFIAPVEMSAAEAAEQATAGIPQERAQAAETAGEHEFAHAQPSDGGAVAPSGSLRRWRWLAAGSVALLVLAAVAARLYFPASAKYSVPQPRLLPFTSLGGDKDAPAFSPDGNALAYTWQGENPTNLGVYHVYVQLVGTSTPLELTKAEMRDEDPSWSPDGRFVAFWRHLPGGTVDNDIGAYYIVPALGGPERKLAEGYQGFSTGGLSWSPDGNTLAVIDQGSRPDPNPTVGLWFISAETGERRNSGIVLPARFAANPAFSPDGKWLAFFSGVRPSSSDVYVVSVHGGKPRALSSVNALINGIAWSPDSQQVFFDADHQGMSALWRVPISGAPIEPVAGTTYEATEPTISLRGNRLAFLRSHLDTNIWRVPLSAADREPPQRLIESNAEDALPAYSPNGQSIAFASSRSGFYEIYISAADGSNPVALTSLKTFSHFPAWSPDGKQIAFSSRSEGQSHIFIISVEGGSPHRITSGLHSNVSPSWSHDGKWIYFTSNRSGTDQIWRVRTDGADPVQITANGGLRPIESTDGKFLYYYHGGAVWRGDPSDKTERRLLSVAHYQYFALCGNDLCVIDRPSGSAGRFIKFDPLAGHQLLTKPLDIGFQTDRSTGMSISPDGRWLLYTRTDALQSDIMMVENFR